VRGFGTLIANSVPLTLTLSPPGRGNEESEAKHHGSGH
jgi:hypothetical protein